MPSSDGYVVVIHEALCFDLAQGRMNGAPNESRTHSCRLLILLANHYTTRGARDGYVVGQTKIFNHGLKTDTEKL